MSLILRPATPEDTRELGRICYQAFASIANRHNFPVDFPDTEAAVGIISLLVNHPGFYGVVAERDGRIVGSNFLDERSQIAGVGPITVDPQAQDRGVGRRLMQDVMERSASRGFAGTRLLQAGYHTRSLSLYASLGFQVREPVACMQGPPTGTSVPGRAVRTATEADLEECSRVSRRVHGHDRAGEVRDAIGAGTATVVEHDGQITGYSTSVAFFGHTVGETEDDVKALIGAAPRFDGPGFLVPARSALFHWCLSKRLRLAQMLTLMSVGLYNEPRGAFLPSILY